MQLAIAGQPITSKQEITMYDGPRSGLFCAAGKVLGKLPAGTKLDDYEEVTSWCGFFKKNAYVKYRRVEPSGSSAIVWVRRNNNDGTDRFEVGAR